MIRPLTKVQLSQIVSDYHAAFADWVLLPGVGFHRSAGLLRQHIGFEALRSGAYRPSCSVELLMPPNLRVLHRFLDVRHRQVELRAHERVRPAVAAAMEEQFQPHVRGELTCISVLALMEVEIARDKITNPNCLAGAAALSALVGDGSRARGWCRRALEQLPEGEAIEWKGKLREYVVQLRDSIG